MVIVSTWRKICGIAFFSRYLVNYMREFAGENIKIDLAEIDAMYMK
jgi:hypothetical protein